jgi:ATP-dependent helicase/nuclease subunit B
MPDTPSDPSPYQPELDLFSEEPDAPAPVERAARDLTRTFIGWETPVLETTTRHLAKAWTQTGALDLADTLVIVPTRNAGRRLREALALHAAESGAAVFPPLVTTQDFLVSPERLPSGPHPVADRHATRLIWSALLLDIQLSRFRRIFPVDPVDRNLSWAMKNAGEILDVRNLLAESGLTFATASGPLQERDMEPARWNELSHLEELAVARTESLGLRDETQARLEASKSGFLPAEIQRILVAACPDFHPVSSAALQHYAKTIPVEILVHAPESESFRFDQSGRPVAVHWLDAEIQVVDPENRIHDAATPTLQAGLACDLIGQSESPAAFVAIGVPDPEVTPPLEQSAARRGWSTHDPAGKAVSRHGIYYLLDQTAALLATRSFESVTRLIRCPDVGRALAAHLKEAIQNETGATRFLRLLDQLRERCLPDRLEDAISAAKRNFSQFPELETGLRWIEAWMSRFRKETFGDTLAAYLSEIFAGRKFSTRETSHGAFPEVAATILEADGAFEATRSAFPGKITPAERFQVLLELIRERHLYEEREPDDIDLQGWLELLWEDAPHLIVTGMNDHVVPESIIGHAFLPDSARRVLGIPNNDDRFARDAYLLTSSIESRNGRGGRLDLIFGRQSESGDPLRPSRLLFQCSDEELPHRTLQFFNGETPSHSPLPWQLPWKLKPAPLPDDAKIFQRLSVTQFRNYLTCPFRFYLQHGLRMEEVDSEKAEMDARDFGNLVHDALEKFSRDEEASHSTDVKVITECLENAVDALLYQRYGSDLTTPVLIQREAARRRLAWWAETEAAERAAGWRILEPETSISTDEHPFAIAGHPISGRIDRIEQHEDGRLRVFDFKTHAIYDASRHRNKHVSEYHFTHIKRTEDPESFPEWARFKDEKGKQQRWIDLQIPLYLLALTERYPDLEISGGHVALGPTRAEIVLDLWNDLDRDRLDSAKRCAEGVIESIRNRIFWPPAARYPWTDPFEELLFGEASESVDAAELSGGRGK